MAGPIASLDDLSSGVPITEEQLHTILNKIAVKIHNILHADGYLGAIDYEEFGDTGHRVYFSNTLRELREQHAYFSALLADPESRGDVGYFMTQNIPPVLVVTNNVDADRRD